MVFGFWILDREMLISCLSDGQNNVCPSLSAMMGTGYGSLPIRQWVSLLSRIIFLRFFWTCGETEGVANSFLGKMHPEALLDKDLITHQVCL
jgi:hypothetical protein